jgi:teichuronic acid biosynthesis glycosyltransferase TuaC
LRILAIKRRVATEHIAPYVDREIAALRLGGSDILPFELDIRRMIDVISETRRLRRTIAEQSIGIVHSHFGDIVGFAAAVASFGAAHLVVTFRGSDLNPAPSVTWCRLLLGHMMSHLAAFRAIRIICVSNELRDRLIWGRSRAVVLPTGVPTDLFRPKSCEACRVELRWPPDRLVVLINAGPAPMKKRIDLAERAIKKAQNRLPNLELVALDGTVPQERVMVMLNAANCLLLCSDYEGSPTILQEAMACNTPVVSTNVGDAAQRLEGVQACRIVDQNEDAIADALAEIVSGRRRSDGAFKARQDLDCGVIAHAIAKIYNGLTSTSKEMV